VPPKRAAKKLTKIAPYNPALGPKPELTPKARANGRATIPAVIPPNRSPFMFVKSNNFFIEILWNLEQIKPIKKIRPELSFGFIPKHTFLGVRVDYRPLFGRMNSLQITTH
jgi:hypothetical protein